LGYPAITDLATFATILVVGLPSVFLLSKALKLHPKITEIANKKKEALTCLIVFIMVFAGAFAIYDFYDKIWIRATLTADPLYVVRDVIAMAIILLPVTVALIWSKQNLKSVAVAGTDLRKNFALGALTSIVLILFFAILAPFLGGHFAGFSVATGYLLLSYVIIGFAEEIIFRGYIQTRLAANNGAFAGIGVTTVLYSIYNFPSGYFCYSGNIQLAAIYALWRVSTGLVYSYTFYKTQNILCSIVVHIFLVWGGLLFALYL
jgi:membrane protease YdiL (CAAX protease family)